MMVGHKICFYGEILLIIPKLSLLPLLIWSTGQITFFLSQKETSTGVHVFLEDTSGNGTFINGDKVGKSTHRRLLYSSSCNNVLPAAKQCRTMAALQGTMCLSFKMASLTSALLLWLPPWWHATSGSFKTTFFKVSHKEL